MADEISPACSEAERAARPMHSERSASAYKHYVFLTLRFTASEHQSLRATFLWLLALGVKESNSGVGETPQKKTGVWGGPPKKLAGKNAHIFVSLITKRNTVLWLFEVLKVTKRIQAADVEYR